MLQELFFWLGKSFRALTIGSCPASMRDNDAYCARKAVRQRLAGADGTGVGVGRHSLGAYCAACGRRYRGNAGGSNGGYRGGDAGGGFGRVNAGGEFNMGGGGDGGFC